MTPLISPSPARSVRRLLGATALAVGALAATSAAADAAVTASFTPASGTLTVIGDNNNNTITLSRDAAGRILVNGGAVAVLGGTPSVANVAVMQTFGLGGQDTLSLSEVNGALPRANLFGGSGERHADRRLRRRSALRRGRQ